AWFLRQGAQRCDAEGYLQPGHRQSLGCPSRQDVRLLVVRAANVGPLSRRADDRPYPHPGHPAGTFRALAAAFRRDDASALPRPEGGTIRGQGRTDRPQPAIWYRGEPGRDAVSERIPRRSVSLPHANTSPCATGFSPRWRATVW